MRRADHSTKAVLPTVVCLSVIVKPRYGGGPGPLGAVSPWSGGEGECIVQIPVLDLFALLLSCTSTGTTPAI